MSLNIEVGTNIKYTNETGTHYLYEGDKVICHTERGTYSGTLSWIGLSKDNPDAELQPFVFIDTFKSVTNITRNIIKVKDIINIYKNPFYDNEKKCSTGQNILNTLIEKGYSQEQAKAVRDRMSDATMFYFIPYMKASTYALEAVKDIISDKTNAKDIIMDAAKQCTEEAQREFLELIEIYAKEIEQCDRDALCLADTLEIVSKCWNDLKRQKTDSDSACKN